MLEQASLIGFVPVADLAETEKFFTHALGLKVQARQDGLALVLAAAGGASIRCVLTPDAVPQTFTILGWEVPDLKAAAAGLVKAGVQPILYPHFEQSPEGIWTAPTGDQVLWFHDPTGNVLSLSQHVVKTQK